MPATAKQEHAACGATRHCYQRSIQIAGMREWSDVGQFVVGVALFGIEWSAATAVVMVIMNVTKITD
jgi:hypothetical protein